jgi:dihydroneopterin aldolase
MLKLLREAGFAGAMLDTADKSNGRLLDHADLPTLRRFVEEARQHGLLAGLAGALEAPDVPRLLLLEPDIIGFRSALCAPAGRDGAVSADAVAVIRGLIPREAATGEPGIDYRLLAARGYAPDTSDPTQHDRIFVRDFILPVRIGAYAREHATPQRVRFNVEAIVARAARPTQDMRDVVSYDLIRDGIALIAASGHIALAETLAEQIATVLLAHPRIVKVAVQIEKLDAGVGTVGVAIERTRGSAGGARILQLPEAAP